ncbi:equilibrative nucleoside transporter 1 [Teleopsis dalmanni]|uniref:equilibrative nucleoside transporter 1 n=1 Tax=Teleopsis dalmanni TaxID=139649 RepID=UPI0018CDA070|nr:equilibrative nucleoside transporter 1 [Teleopsis dalmanni]
MPTRLLGSHRGAEHNTESQVLVDNEEVQPTDAYDNDDYERSRADAGGFVNDNDYSIRFVPATLPTPTPFHNHEFHNVELQPTHVTSIDAPPDRFHFAYIVFYLLGVVTMTPWNFFVTAEDYWMYKFRNTTINNTADVEIELTPMQKSFECDLTLTASISGTTFLILNAIYGHKVPLKLKMLGTLVIILIIFFITTAFVEINTDRWQEQFFLITIFTVIIINISSATMSGGIFGIAGLFPSEYMTALVSGQALGGIFTALAFIVVLAFNAGPNTTAFIYFSIGSVLISLSIIAYEVMSRQSFFRFYLEGGNKLKPLDDTPSTSRTNDLGITLEPNINEVMSKIYVDVVSICILFTTTLSVYPSVTVLMQSENFGNGNAWNDIYYLPVVNYLFFNSGDYFGRIIAGLWEKPQNSHTVLLMTLLRILYVPFLLCSNTNQHYFLPTLVHSDYSFITMIITFALSNGYLTNIILMRAPLSVLQHEKEMASSIMVAALSFGLALGSILSMIFVQML